MHMSRFYYLHYAVVVVCGGDFVECSMWCVCVCVFVCVCVCVVWCSMVWYGVYAILCGRSVHMWWHWELFSVVLCV